MSLSLYRRILRVARTCTRRTRSGSPVRCIPSLLVAFMLYDVTGEGGYVEQQWIRDEARRRFEESRTLTDPAAIEEAVRQGHNQVDVALHYKICYPRPEYVDPGTMGGESNFRRQSSRSNTRLGRLHKSKVQNQFRPGGR